MEKWLLVEVREREISTPQFFASKEEAYDEMCRRFVEVTDILIEELPKYSLDGEENDSYNTYIEEDEARTEKHGNNYDWKIFAL